MREESNINMDYKQVNRVEKGRFLDSISGKIILMTIISTVISITIGIIGILSVQQNSVSSQIQRNASDISMLQLNNESQRVLYQHYLEQSYLENILANLNRMSECSEKLDQINELSIKWYIDTIKGDIEKCKANYEKIVQLSNIRGFNTMAGQYAEYTKNIDSIDEQLRALETDNDWVGSSIDEGVKLPSQEMIIDGQKYIKAHYVWDLPQNGKKDHFLARMAGQNISYSKPYYISNLVFSNDAEEENIDFSKFSKADLAESNGESLESYDLDNLNGERVIKVITRFDPQNDSWTEAVINIPIIQIESQKYLRVSYDLYFVDEVDPALRVCSAISGQYKFVKKKEELSKLVSKYTGLVTEGKEIDGILKEIQKLFNELIENSDKYSENKELVDSIYPVLIKAKDQFNKMSEIDKELLDINRENIALSAELTTFTQSIKDTVGRNMDGVQSKSRIFILAVLIIGALVIVVFNVIVIRNIKGSIDTFSKTIKQITDGDISIHVDTTKNDEFKKFASYLNAFLNRISNVILTLQEMTDTLSKSGDLLQIRANNTNSAAGSIGSTLENISHGAIQQAKNIESSSHKIIEMGEIIDSIIENIQMLNRSANEMENLGQDSERIMIQLKESSDKNISAFEKIDEQIHMTDQSVQEIKNVVELITSVAEQTKLLSLNASIEAARAGETGKGFAIVATEIQKLSDQTNASAKVIDDIINKLSDKSKSSVKSIQEITEIINEQKQKLEDTQTCFNAVRRGIHRSSEETSHIIGQAGECNTARENAMRLITNLAAISEENAAATEHTNQSMQDLNQSTAVLAETARDLKEIAENLREDLRFFKL